MGLNLVPTVSVGIHKGTLLRSVTQERHKLHSHAEHGNERAGVVTFGFSAFLQHALMYSL